MNARDEILARIQRTIPATPRNSAEAHTAIQRQYIQAATLDPEARLDLFEERLRDYGTEVFRCVRAQLADTITEAMKAADVTNLVAANGVREEWLPHAGVSFRRDNDLSYDDLDRSQGVLTTCAAAIALTGTIILRHPQDGRRAITLIPDYHLCIVKAEQVYQTVPEAIRSLESPGRSPLTTVSGPSATSDIEMTRIKGVHGPRKLAMILLLA